VERAASKAVANLERALTYCKNALQSGPTCRRVPAGPASSAQPVAPPWSDLTDSAARGRFAPLGDESMSEFYGYTSVCRQPVLQHR
jgi:hypothetical protein